MKESCTRAEQTMGHIPNSLAAVLCQPLVDGNITINDKITGQSRSAPEGAWVQLREKDWRFPAFMKCF